MKIISLLLIVITTIIITISIQKQQHVSALRFGIIGDWGMGGRKTPWDPEIRSAAAFSEACETFFAEGFCNLTISCGDNIYTPDVGMGLRESFKLFSKNIGPVFASSGNHDNMGPQMQYAKIDKRWKWPSRWYDFKVPIDDHGIDGHTVHFFALDVMAGGLAPGGAQYKWLEEKLKTCNSRWKFFFGHFPVAGAGRHRREGSVTALTTLMDKYNVQAYFSGHDHILDINVNVGKVLPISGAMSRGGMMLRGIAGGHHVYTLTQPGEYNANIQDWPGHGFFTAEISPNILTVHSWDHYGAILYTFQVTHDWVSKVHSQPKSLEHKFPPVEEIRAAALAETILPRGPGGGKFYNLDGEEFDAPKYFQDGSSAVGTAAPNQEKKPQLTEKPLDTSFTKFKDERPFTTETKIDHFKFTTTLAAEEKLSRQEQELLAKYVRYTVSSECINCDRDIFAQESFSVFVLGVDLGSKARMFLSQSKIGCAMSKYFPKHVEGTKIIQPNGNQAIFTASRSTASAYVCLSTDAGKTFNLIKRADDEEFVDEFQIGSVRSEEQKKSLSDNNKNQQQQQQQSKNQQQATSAPPKTSSTNSKNTDGDTNTNDVDTSTAGQLLMVAGFSLFIGVGFAWMAKTDFLEGIFETHQGSSSSSGGGSRLATTDEEEQGEIPARGNQIVEDEQ